VLKIAFISPYYHNIFEALGIGYIAAYCQKNFHGKLEFSYYNFVFDCEEEAIKDIIDNHIDIVAFTSTTPTYQSVVEINNVLKYKNPNIFSVLGGWHATVLPSDGLKYFDTVICGEGEKAFLSVLNGNTQPLIFGEPNIEFSELPFPDRVLINNEDTLSLCFDICGERIAAFQSRRGCPFSCKMCAEHCMSNNNIRVRDPNDLLDEIEYVEKKFNISKFKFVDPSWDFPTADAIAFCETKLQRNNKLPWEGMVHAAFMSKDLMKLMKRSDCSQMNVGVESGSQQLLNYMGKGVTVEKIKKVFRWGKELGIHMRAFFLLGMPDETESTVEETRQLAREIDPDEFGMTLLAPYPGTYFYDPIKHKDIDWSEVDEYSNNFWETKYFSNAELRTIQKSFADEFDSKLTWHQKYIMVEA